MDLYMVLGIPALTAKMQILKLWMWVLFSHPLILSASESLIPDCPSLIGPHPQEDWKGNGLWNFWGADIPAGFLFPHSLAYLKCLQITAMGISRGLYGKSVYVLGDFIWSAAAFWPNWQTFLWTKGRRPPTRIPYMKRHAGLLCIQIGFGWEVKGERCM